jgi:hypothetical protein
VPNEKRKAAKETREEWLVRAMDKMRPWFAVTNKEVPKNLRISCGFPHKGAFAKRKRRIGECWSDHLSKGKVFEIFISPTQEEPLSVLNTVLHEMVHATVGLSCGHKGDFRKVCLVLGFMPPMTETPSSPDLHEKFKKLFAELGPYPHEELTNMRTADKPQKGRMIKVVCVDAECGYTIRTTAKWLEKGTPTCVCGEEMEPVNWKPEGGGEEQEPEDAE